ncbi:AbrB/MazE/SpoVT family DNA-binding domain-containing protein [Streptomyces sp. 7-21]|jgi:AbrB family looped-hinge helix DNA binding protein|nr:AbrB/MazE/SpoVT family DNA-binding domain-containing protein [Streptomyces sp. 7-21]
MAHGEDSENGSENKASYGPKGRGFYGAVTVSERGQVVIPAQARRDLGIGVGDKLLVLGDPESGLALMKIDVLMRMSQQGATGLFEQFEQDAEARGEASETADKEDTDEG